MTTTILAITPIGWCGFGLAVQLEHVRIAAVAATAVVRIGGFGVRVSAIEPRGGVLALSGDNVRTFTVDGAKAEIHVDSQLDPWASARTYAVIAGDHGSRSDALVRWLGLEQRLAVRATSWSTDTRVGDPARHFFDRLTTLEISHDLPVSRAA
jgi:hypothetical protein